MIEYKLFKNVESESMTSNILLNGFVTFDSNFQQLKAIVLLSTNYKNK